MLFIITSLSAGISSVQAVGPNQNDFYQWWGTGFGDLPDDSNQIQNMSYLFPVQFMSPYYSGIMTAELDVNDDEDWFSFIVAGTFNSTLGTYQATEELDIQITYSNTYTSPSNGSVYNNNFLINLYDWNMALINSSTTTNPGFVSTSGTTATPGNCCGYYVQVIRNQGYGSYDTEFWLRSTSSGNPGTSGQNDLGFGTDLPDSQNLAINGNYVVQLTGLSPVYSGIALGELDVGDNQDWFVVNLDVIDGLEIEINYSPTSTSPTNGTVYNNEFELAIFDSNNNQIDYSYQNNPEIVTTNASTSSHGGTIYVQIIRISGYGQYDLELWTWNTQSGGGSTSNQNDLGQPNYDLPDSSTALQSDPNFPLPLNGAAPLYSGIDYAELDLNGDNEDWLSFTLDANEGFAFQITYAPTSISGTTTYNNEFDLFMFDANMNQIDSSIGNNPEYVTTNNTATIPGGNPHGGTIYIQIYRYDGFGTYDLEFWTWSTSSTGGEATEVGDNKYRTPVMVEELLVQEMLCLISWNKITILLQHRAPHCYQYTVMV